MAAGFNSFAEALAKFTQFCQKNMAEPNKNQQFPPSMPMNMPLQFLLPFYPLQNPLATIKGNDNDIESTSEQGIQLKESLSSQQQKLNDIFPQSSKEANNFGISSETSKEKIKKQSHKIDASSTTTATKKLLRTKKNSSGEEIHRSRKLKLYSVDEKLDIIDYAKFIGNRATGREFGVAESSIREWRKNEDKLRSQTRNETNTLSETLEKYPDVINHLDKALVDYTNANINNLDFDWHTIGKMAKNIWLEMSVSLAVPSELHRSELDFSMGWIARFMKRNEELLPKIPPCSSKNIVEKNFGQCNNIVTAKRCLYNKQAIRTKKMKTKLIANNSTPIYKAEKGIEDAEEQNNHIPVNRISRRKAKNPKRFDPSEATLLTTTTLF